MLIFEIKSVKILILLASKKHVHGENIIDKSSYIIFFIIIADNEFTLLFVLISLTIFELDQFANSRKYCWVKVIHFYGYLFECMSFTFKI